MLSVLCPVQPHLPIVVPIISQQVFINRTTSFVCTAFCPWFVHENSPFTLRVLHNTLLFRDFFLLY